MLEAGKRTDTVATHFNYLKIKPALRLLSLFTPQLLVPPHETMWDDEDNNPYGSFHRRDSEASDIHSPPFHRPATPPSADSSPDTAHPFAARPASLSDEDLTDTQSHQPASAVHKDGTYTSRIEQILYDHPDRDIQIIHAGKNTEGGGGFIAYTIRTGDIDVRRRYSEFASLRSLLVALHPTCIVPPIPEKHSIVDYAARPTRAKEDAGIIDLRRRMLATFLNRCRRMPVIRNDGVWWRFLDPNVSWAEVLNTPPASTIPKNPLKSPPLDPANPTPAHAWLPVPSQTAKLRATDDDPLTALDLRTKELEVLLSGPLEKAAARLLRHAYAWGDDLMDLGARYNAFSLSESLPAVAEAIEKTGQACDFTYIQSRDLAGSVGAGFADPMREGAQLAGVVRAVLRFRALKRVQEDLTREELERKKNVLEGLERSEGEARRIERYMESSGIVAPGSTRVERPTSSSSSTGAGMKEEDNNSVDSDFPPSASTSQTPSASQGAAATPETPPTTPHRRVVSSGASNVATKLLTRLSPAAFFTSAVDADPERARRDALGKTQEGLAQLEQALEVVTRDVKEMEGAVDGEIRRWRQGWESDLIGYMLNYAKCHLEWSRRSLEEWGKAKEEIGKIEDEALQRGQLTQ